MINLKQWMEVVNYRITEGSKYCWNCFGDKAYTLDSWNGDHDGFSHSITFDTETQMVFMVEVFDYARGRAYRIINPMFKQIHDNEVNQRGLNNEAWEGVNFTDLETDEDWLEKACAIFNGEDYDTRISVPLDFTDEELLEYMIMAHKQDMSFNQFVEKALQHAIDEFHRDPEALAARARAWRNQHDVAG